MAIGKRMVAEFLGTFWLVFGGCGSAVLAAAYPTLGIGFLGVAFAFGLSLMTMVYAIGKISGCHVNPAVTVGLAVAKRFPSKDVIPYIISQVIGAIAAAAVLYVVASGKPGFSVGSFASNGYGEHSPGGYSMVSCLVSELVLTFMFVMIILGTIHAEMSPGFAPISIGFALAVIHMIGIPVTNLSVNPARSTGPAIIAGGWALSQLWFFWVVPILGGALAGLMHPLVHGRHVPGVD